MENDTNDSWKMQDFRQKIVVKIDEEIKMSGVSITSNALEIESYVFQKVKTKEEYLQAIAKLILYSREMKRKNATGNASGTAGINNQGMPDPIGALQTLACQGTRNNPPQMSQMKEQKRSMERQIEELMKEFTAIILSQQRFKEQA